jgi:FkbM family methyltransferase
MSLTQDHIVWAYRLLLDREPEENYNQGLARAFNSTRVLRDYFVRSVEYSTKNNCDPGTLNNIVVICRLDHYGIDGRLFINLSDSIGLGIAHGHFETEEVAFVKANLRSGQTFVDVGANIGFYSVLASAVVGGMGVVFSFEALSQNMGMLEKSLHENRFCNNVRAVQAIVGDKPRDDMCIVYQPLEEGAGNSGGASIAEKHTPIPSFLKKEAVRQGTLDDLLPVGAPVDFLKIDIEGAEVLAMLGASRILSSYRPTILSEVHTSHLKIVSGASWQDYFDLMKAFGYEPFFIRGGAVHSRADDLEDNQIYTVAFVTNSKR